MEVYERKLAAAQEIMEFMGTLVPRYTAPQMSEMWDALGAMTQRYGYIFVADSIRKSDVEAELALTRYGRRTRPW